MTSKEIPSELRRAAGTLENGTVHGDLRNYEPTAGPSTSQQTFRSNHASSSRDQSAAQSSFIDFASQPASLALPPEPESRAASTRLRYTAEDLQPRPEDSAAVMALFQEENEFDNVEAVLNEVSERQSLPWHSRQDAIVPQDPAPPHAALHSPEATYTSDDYPYLFNLLSLPEDESIAAYLSEMTYSDDVWGLPMAIKQDLDTIKAPTTDDAAREKAVRRLGMLKNHLLAKAKPLMPSTAPLGPAKSMTDADWDWIWNKQPN